MRIIQVEFPAVFTSSLIKNIYMRVFNTLLLATLLLSSGIVNASFSKHGLLKSQTEGYPSINEADSTVDVFPQITSFNNTVFMEKGVCQKISPEAHSIMEKVFEDFTNLDFLTSFNRIENTLKTHPNDFHLKYLQAINYAELLQTPAAVFIIEALRKQCPGRSDLAYRLAILHINSGALSKAEAALQSIPEEGSKPDTFNLLTALILLNKARPKQALIYLNKIKEPEVLGDMYLTVHRSVLTEIYGKANFYTREAEEPSLKAVTSEVFSDTENQNKPGDVKNNTANNQRLKGPSTPKDYLEKLDVLSKKNDKLELENLINQFTNSHPDLPLTHFVVFDLAISLNDYILAEQSLKKLESLASGTVTLPMLHGTLARAKGDFYNAEKLYKEQIQLTPESRTAYEELVDVYMESGDFRKLITFHDETKAIFPENYFLTIRKAKAYRDLGFPLEAITWYDKAIKILPERSIAYRAKGFAYLLLGKFDNAKKYFEISLKKEPDNIEGLTGIASVYRLRGAYDLALEYANKAITVSPYSVTANIAFARINYKIGNITLAEKICDDISEMPSMGYFQRMDLAFCYEHTGRLDDALQLTEELYNQYQHPLLMLDIARFFQQKKRLPEAKLVLEKLLSQDISHIMVIEVYAGLLFEMELFDESAQQYYRLVGYQENSLDYWTHLYNSLRASGRSSETIKALRKLNSLEPNNVNTVFNLAASLENEGHITEALEWYENLSLIDANGLDSIRALARFYFNTKDYSRSLEYLERGLAMNPENTIFLELAASAASYLKYDTKKISYSQRLLNLNSATGDTYNWLGENYGKNNQLKKAEEFFKKAIEVNPKSQQYVSNLGYCYYLQQRHYEALEQYTKALTLPVINTSSAGLVHYNMGLVYRKLKNYRKAVSAFTKANNAGYPPK